MTSGDPMEDGTETQRFTLLRNPNFRLLWVGEAISLLGDQFYIIALPWLVLILTGDPLALGLVLALTAIPRAVFMLVGGAFTDRYSPRVLMILSNSLRLVIVGLLAALVLSSSIQIWMLYLFAISFGLADALFYPAQFSILPQMVEGWQLKAANSLVQAVTQFSLLLGPALAGLTIALLGGRSGDLSGIGIALTIDAFTFVASLVTLSLIRIERRKEEMETNLLRSVREGLAFMLKDPGLRALLLILAATNLLVAGPFDVGIPVLAESRLPEGVAAFGILLSAFGGGSLVGLTIAGVLPEPRRRFGPVLVMVVVLFGVGTAAFAFAGTTLVAGVDTFLMGVMIGYIDILIITWVQHRTPIHLMGRMMGMLMFASAGMLPVSFAVSGAVISWSLPGLFIIAGALMVMLGVVMALLPSVRRIGW